LVMAARLMDEDPELAFQHALAASRRGGRMAPVREAVGLTAYAAGHYGEALREFRTYRRISGSNAHLPVMADCERGLGRPDRALEMVRSEDATDLDAAGKVELAIVASGARMDLEQYDAAVAALEIPQLDKNRAFSYSPRLFRAYADALESVNRAEEAEQWRRQARLAESALGVGEFAEPEIFDLVDEDEEPEARRPRDVSNGYEAVSGEAAGSAEPDEEASGGAEADTTGNDVEPRLSEAALEDEDLHEIEDPAPGEKDVKHPGDED
jgi:tetratricopeptide (TPR) repeat protein